MSFRAAAVSLATATAVAAGLATVGAAHAAPVAPGTAATKVVVQDRGDTRSGADDLRTLTVRVTSSKVVIRAAFADADYGDLFSFWIDTSNKSRNYYGAIVPESGFAPLRLVRGQGTRGPFGECRGFKARYLSGSRQAARVAIPLRCVGDPRRLKVSTTALLGTEESPVRDSAPNRRGWTKALTVVR